VVEIYIYISEIIEFVFDKPEARKRLDEKKVWVFVCAKKNMINKNSFIYS